MSGPVIVFRVDSSGRIGSGHLARCRTLARDVMRRGATARFICRAHPTSLHEALRADGFEVIDLPAPPDANRRQADQDYAASLGVTERQDAADTLDAITGAVPSWLVVDHYALGDVWERAMRQRVGRVMVIDDLANRAHDCDVLVDQNWFGDATSSRYRHLVPESCRLLLGPRYAMLPQEYALLRQVAPRRTGDVRRVVVYFGASDDSNHTLRAIEALTAPQFLELAVDVVVGHNHPAPRAVSEAAARRPMTTVYRGLPTISGLLMRADVAIGAGGATTWERAALGLPSLTVVVAENQRLIAEALAADGITRVIDAVATSEEWQDALTRALSDREWIECAARRAAALSDARGAARVAHILCAPEPIRVRPATAADERQLLEWANDPGVRTVAFDERPIAASGHAQWLAGKLADPGCLMLIGEDPAGLAVGQVRFDLDRTTDEAAIDISVDPGCRGLGVGRRLLVAALDIWRARRLSARAVAEVRTGNTASAHLFAGLGFVEAPPRRAGAMCFVHAGVNSTSSEGVS